MRGNKLSAGGMVSAASPFTAGGCAMNDMIARARDVLFIEISERTAERVMGWVELLRLTARVTALGSHGFMIRVYRGHE